MKITLFLITLSFNVFSQDTVKIILKTNKYVITDEMRSLMKSGKFVLAYCPSFDKKIFDSINEYRVSKKLSILEHSNKLDIFVQRQLYYMLSGHGRVHYNNIDEMVELYGLNTAENLNGRTSYLDNMNRDFKSFSIWKASPGHNKNMLDSGVDAMALQSVMEYYKDSTHNAFINISMVWEAVDYENRNLKYFDDRLNADHSKPVQNNDKSFEIVKKEVLLKKSDAVFSKWSIDPIRKFWKIRCTYFTDVKMREIKILDNLITREEATEITEDYYVNDGKIVDTEVIETKKYFKKK